MKEGFLILASGVLRSGYSAPGRQPAMDFGPLDWQLKSEEKESLLFGPLLVGLLLVFWFL